MYNRIFRINSQSKYEEDFMLVSYRYRTGTGSAFISLHRMLLPALALYMYRTYKLVQYNALLPGNIP